MSCAPSSALPFPKCQIRGRTDSVLNVSYERSVFCLTRAHLGAQIGRLTHASKRFFFVDQGRLNQNNVSFATSLSTVTAISARVGDLTCKYKACTTKRASRILSALRSTERKPIAREQTPRRDSKRRETDDEQNSSDDVPPRVFSRRPRMSPRRCMLPLPRLIIPLVLHSS